MAKPTSIDGGAPDLSTQKAHQLELIVQDVEDARIKQSAILSLTENRTPQFPAGVTSIVIHDMEAPGVEDTKFDGTEQADLAGGATPQTLTFDQFKTAPGYFYYVLGEASRISYLRSFLNMAPTVSLKTVTDGVINALRGIGATNYRQLSGTDLQGTANRVIDSTDISAGKDVVRALSLSMSDTFIVCDEGMEDDLPTIFNLYSETATSVLGDRAKITGSIGVALGLPIFIERTEEFVRAVNAQCMIFHRSAASWAIRTAFTLDFEQQKSKARDYYGIRFSYGVNLRDGNRGLVLQDGVAFAA